MFDDDEENFIANPESDMAMEEEEVVKKEFVGETLLKPSNKGANVKINRDETFKKYFGDKNEKEKQM